MNSVRLGIVGMGNIGRHHADCLLAAKVHRCELTAVCSTSPHKLEPYRAKGLRIFDRAEKLIALAIFASTTFAIRADVSCK